MKQSQERDWFHQRPKKSQSSSATSYSFSSRPLGWYLSLTIVQILDPSWSGIKWYVNSFLSDDLPDHTFLHHTDHFSFSDWIRFVFRREWGDHLKSSDHTIGSKAMSVKKSDQKSTVYATTKLAINLVKESLNALPPLKSVVGGLLAILNHCEVCPMAPRLCHPWCSQLC